MNAEGVYYVFESLFNQKILVTKNVIFPLRANDQYISIAVKMAIVHMNLFLGEFLGALFFAYVSLITKLNPLAMGLALGLVIVLVGATTNPLMAIAQTMVGRLPQNKVLPICLAQAAGFIAGVEIFRRL